MRSALVALSLLALSVPAFAADDVKGADAKGGQPGTNVDMPFVMAPLPGADGKLSGYAYISSRLTATSNAGALAVRDKLAFIQHAFVRDVNGAPIANTDDLKLLDQAALTARLLADAAKVMGPGKVASIAIVQIQFAPLHPKQTPNLYAPPEPLDSAKEAASKPAPAKAGKPAK